MTWRGALATAVVIVTAWPATAAAQATPLPAPLELRQQEVSREERARRAVVRPPIKMDEAVRQAERDAAEVEQAQRTERWSRASSSAPSSARCAVDSSALTRSSR